MGSRVPPSLPVPLSPLCLPLNNSCRLRFKPTTGVHSADQELHGALSSCMVLPRTRSWFAQMKTGRWDPFSESLTPPHTPFPGRKTCYYSCLPMKILSQFGLPSGNFVSQSPWRRAACRPMRHQSPYRRVSRTRRRQGEPRRGDEQGNWESTYSSVPVTDGKTRYVCCPSLGQKSMKHCKVSMPI